MVNNIEEMKERVGIEAFDYIKPNSIIGLGSGTTVKFLIQQIGEKVRNNLLENVIFVCSSIETEKICIENNIEFSSIENIESIDLYIDGADEITKTGIAIKGLGGALTREKILRKISYKFIVIVTSNKQVKFLGEKSPIPVEILQFGYKNAMKKILQIKSNKFPIKYLKIRKKLNQNELFVSDNNNYIVDIFLEEPLRSEKPHLMEVDNSLKLITGVVETGLFLDPADIILLGDLEKKEIKKIVV